VWLHILITGALPCVCIQYSAARNLDATGPIAWRWSKSFRWTARIVPRSAWLKNEQHSCAKEAARIENEECCQRS
jgi:hypothetical protein